MINTGENEEPVKENISRARRSSQEPEKGVEREAKGLGGGADSRG